MQERRGQGEDVGGVLSLLKRGRGEEVERERCLLYSGEEVRGEGVVEVDPGTVRPRAINSTSPSFCELFLEQEYPLPSFSPSSLSSSLSLSLLSPSSLPTSLLILLTFAKHAAQYCLGTAHRCCAALSACAVRRKHAVVRGKC